MGKLIKITNDYKSTEKYRSAVNTAIEKLESIEDDLRSLIIDIATSGKWKEWSDNVPIGEIFDFTQEILRDTGDNNVNDIVCLQDEVTRIKEKIKSGR